MLPVDFEGTNIELTKPQGWADEKCMSVRAYKGVDTDGIPFYLTAWKPNREDIEAINAGRPIMLKVCGNSTPPVAMYTFDENYNGNF